MADPLPGHGHSAGLSVVREAHVDFVEGMSAAVNPVETVIRELAQSDVPVLLLGEPGSGKHATARRIHQLSRHGSKPFRSLLCSMLKPEGLTVPGGVGLLSVGTIYLEEVADLSAQCQSCLLEALPQSGMDKSANAARLICGSGRDLDVEVKAGRLREDLYYRISGVALRLPPLRQRREDIPGLLEYFLRKYAEDFRRSKPDLSAETRSLFQEYAWPGNLRELEDAAKMLVAVGNQELATTGLRALQRPPGAASVISLKAASKAASREAEKDMILKALTRTRWNRRRAAEELQISYKALLYKLKQIGCQQGFGTP
jgi:two-component system response regulator AtoC